MEQDAQKSFPLLKAYAFAAENGLTAEAERIRDLELEGIPTKRLERVIRKGYIIRLFEDRGIYSTFIDRYWPYGSTDDGQKRRGYAVRLADEYKNSQNDEEADDEIAIESDEFAMETHLRDFLAKGNNLNQVETGLRIYENNGKTGIEYEIDNGKGRIDILAIDSNNNFVVIELKLRRGRNKALGQLLYYMGWMDANFGSKAQSCRGLIIANDISEELKIAVSQVPRVKLARYKMNFSIEHV